MASKVFASAVRAASRRGVTLARPSVARPLSALASANLKQTAAKASVRMLM